MKNKKKSNTPRRKSFKRKQRLESAKSWIPAYEGKKLVKGYAKHYGVNLLCAITELQMLGHEFSDNYIKQVKLNIENQRLAKERKKEKKESENLSEPNNYSNDTFAFIAGHTSGGVPYGVTWEEMRIEADEFFPTDVDEKPITIEPPKKRKKFKNHELVNGQLLQTNKNFSHLKQKQKSLIADWFRIEYTKYYETNQKPPNTKTQKYSIIDSVYDRIEEKGIWIPYGEVAKYFFKKQTKIKNKITKKFIDLERSQET